MSKSPAFNFYSSDFDQATKFFSDDEVGKYLRLLITQHHHGHLTLQQMEMVCKGPVPAKVMAKYSKDNDGNYYNERLEDVISKKSAVVDTLKGNLGKYSGKSRAEIAKMKAEEREKAEFPEKEAIETPSTQPEAKKSKAKSREPVILKPPTLEEVEKYFIEHNFPASLAKRAWEGYQENNWLDSQNKEIKNWKLKMQQVWFKEEHKVKTDVGQRPGQVVITGNVPASFKK